MAGGMDLGTSKGGKKPLDAALNLVPFIDMMAVIIIFLIMTAVWTQLGRLQVAQAGQSPSDSDTPPPTTLPVTMLITEKELKLSVGGVPMDAIAIVEATEGKKGRLDLSKLEKKLVELSAQQPDQTAITLQTEDGVKYDILVQVIDSCVGNKFPSVTVSPASS